MTIEQIKMKLEFQYFLVSILQVFSIRKRQQMSKCNNNKLINY